MSSRHSVATFSPNRVPEQVVVVSSDADRGSLSTGQSMEGFCDPISMELSSQTFRLQVHIELSDACTVADEARADSQVASAPRCSEAQRHVSIVAPTALSYFRETTHNLRAQSTHYHLSLPRPHKNSTFVENSMDLTSTASATGGIPPVATTGEMITRPSVVFDQNSFLPFSDFSLQQRVHEVAPSSMYPESGSRSVAPAVDSLPLSHISLLSANVDVENRG